MLELKNKIEPLFTQVFSLAEHNDPDDLKYSKSQLFGVLKSMDTLAGMIHVHILESGLSLAKVEIVLEQIKPTEEIQDRLQEIMGLDEKITEYFLSNNKKNLESYPVTNYNQFQIQQFLLK